MPTQRRKEPSIHAERINESQQHSIRPLTVIVLNQLYILRFPNILFLYKHFNKY